MNRSLLLLFSHFFFLQAFSQYAFYNEHYVEGKLTCELLAEAGTMNCLTDLGGKKGAGKAFIKDLNIEQSRLTFGISGAINYKRILSVRMQLVKGMVSADDRSINFDESAARGRYLRNLNFQTDIHELSLLAEVYPLTLFAREGQWLSWVDWYVFAGLGYYSFNPLARLDNSYVELWPLHTEGQGFAEFPDRVTYRRNQFNLPVGTGVKFEIHSRMNLRLELNYRKLFTDYLDDVSTGYIDPLLFTKYLPTQEVRMAVELADRRLNTGRQPLLTQEIRGNNRNNDAFFSCSLRISVVFGRQRAP